MPRPGAVRTPRCRVRAAVAILALGALSASPAPRAERFDYPPAPTTASDARNTFPDRTDAIIRANACGREDRYLEIRAAMSRGDYESQGEDLSSMLIAKTAWLNGPGGSFGRACETERIYALPQPLPRPDYTLETLRADVEARWTAAALDAKGAPASARCPVAVTVTVAGPNEVRARLGVATDCMRVQVNDSILAMRKTAQMGTDAMTCGPSQAIAKEVLGTFDGTPGDWDANVKELVRLLYLGTSPSGGRRVPVLDPATVDHMYEQLLSARGELGPDSYSLIAGCDNPAGEELGSPEDTADRRAWYREALDWIGDAFQWLAETLMIRVPVLLTTNFVGGAILPYLVVTGQDIIPPHIDVELPETENHRLMIETSRYLTNKDIIRRLKAKDYDNVDDLEDENAEVREWLLYRLNEIARNDFREYNSRPYTRYSLTAVGNLFDFSADDSEITTASRIAMDLSQAKFASGSNRTRRAPPFRRLEEYRGTLGATVAQDSPQSWFYNAVQGTDHEVARSFVFAGQTQLLPGTLPLAGISNLVYAATSGYLPPDPVLDMAVRRPPMLQTFAHSTIEIYAQEPAATISAGGLRAEAADKVFIFGRDKDRGLAQPTMVIPTRDGINYRSVFMFRGLGDGHTRTENLCVARGFACGLDPWLADLPTGCLNRSSVPTAATMFVNSAKCPGGDGPHYYVAIRTGSCQAFCSPGHEWGFLEIVPAPNAVPDNDPAFAEFRRTRNAAIVTADPGANGEGVYVTARGDRIRYRINDARPEIVAVNEQPPPRSTTGGLVNDDGNSAITIGLPGTTSIRINVADPMHPERIP